MLHLQQEGMEGKRGSGTAPGVCVGVGSIFTLMGDHGKDWDWGREEHPQAGLCGGEGMETPGCPKSPSV